MTLNDYTPEVREILRSSMAAEVATMLDFFDTHDWVQDAMYRRGLYSVDVIEGACLVGNLHLHSSQIEHVRDELMKTIREMFPERVDLNTCGCRKNHEWSFSVCTHFNDHPDTTFDDVLEVLRHTEKRLREV